MMKRQTGKAPSLVKSVVGGSAASLSAAFLGAALLAKLLDMELMQMEQTGYWILGLHLIAVFLGARKAMAGMGREGVLSAGITGGLYYLCLMGVNGMFFGGAFQGMGITLLLVIFSSVCAILTGRQGAGKKGRRRYKIPK